MFDTTCANRSLVKELSIPSSTDVASISKTGIITWEEHCIECGQPYCFKTCKMYERAFDGKCKRFKSGIVPIKYGYAVQFKKWGKLEGEFTGRIWGARAQAVFGAVDRAFSALARALNRAMAFIPGRIGAITIYRRFKKWGFEYLPGNNVNRANGLAMSVWADQAIALHFSVIDDEKNIFDSVIELKSGWNNWQTSIPPIGKGARFLLFSTQEKEFTLVFARLDVLVDSVAEVKLDKSSAKSPAKFVKCIAWDLDNTLWKGILVEDGVDAIVVNEDAVRLIKDLDRKGIVHTILSKNDHKNAWKALEKFGLAEYFIFPHINWQPKSGNLKAAAKEINIGLDTFAFIDDSPFERGEVGENLPMVRVFNATEINDLSARPEFNPPVSAESSKRRASYQKEMQRVAAANAFEGDYNAFLKSCEIKLAMFDLLKASEEEYKRCYELIQRTNQLTLAGRRYAEDEFKALVSKSNLHAYGIRCSDKFGDYGIVGAVLFSVNGENAAVEEFVMSCRVAKKKCEDATVNWVAHKAKKLGARVLTAQVVKTGRNMALVSAFSEIAGIEKEESDGGAIFKLDLADLADANIIGVAES